MTGHAEVVGAFLKAHAREMTDKVMAIETKPGGAAIVNLHGQGWIVSVNRQHGEVASEVQWSYEVNREPERAYFQTWSIEA